jgi:uncharacterized protein YukE
MRTSRERVTACNEEDEKFDLEADRCAAKFDKYGESWNRKAAASFRMQALCIQANARGGE